MKIENGIIPKIETQKGITGIDTESEEEDAKRNIENKESTEEGVEIHPTKTELVKSIVDKYDPECLEKDGGMPLCAKDGNELVEVAVERKNRTNLTAGIANSQDPNCLGEDGGHF